MKIGQFIEWERNIGQPVYQTEELTIRPISRSLSVWWRPYGGWVWNLPTGVEVNENNQIRELPIIHVNLWAQVGISLVAGLFSLLLYSRMKE